MPVKTRSTKPQVAIVGVGRLGTALAVALNREHYPIEALVARRTQTAKKAASLLDGPGATLAVNSLENIQAKTVIITTPDDKIQFVAEQLARQPVKGKRVALHTSGALSSSVLSKLKDSGWQTGSLHPLVSVSEPLSGANALRGAYWCVEGDSHALRIAQSIVKDLNGHSFSIKSHFKALYHTAAVMASGNLVALFDVALDMLQRCGLSRRDAKKALLPLIESAVDNLRESDPANALTGTFARADEATVELHLQALAHNNLQMAESLYRILGQRSLELARKRGVDTKALRRISTRLKNQQNK